MKVSLRNEIFSTAKERYGTNPEYPWQGDENSAVLRHSDNKKWYAIVMRIKREKLGLDKRPNKFTDIINIKCDPLMLGSLLTEQGYFPCYHMNRSNWISIILDGSVELDNILYLLNISFDLTSKKAKKAKAPRLVNREWIVPANPKYYDIESAFEKNDEHLWKQSASIIPGDIIYMYLAAPRSAIMFKCRAIETDIPYEGNINGKVKKVMRLKMLHRFEPDELSFATLNEYGVFAVRGPRNVPHSLHCLIDELCGITE